MSNRPFVYGIDTVKNGCCFYRIKQPLYRLSEKDYFPTATTTMLKGDDPTVWLDQCDVLVNQGCTLEKFIDFMVEHKGKKKFVIDSDDDIFSVSPFNPAYREHGVKEVDFELEDGSKVEIRDGKYGFNISENKKRLFFFSECLKHADLVTTPSSILRQKYKNYNHRVQVIKNLVDFRIWNPLPMIKDDWVRIGWQGGWSHYLDFFEVKEALEWAMKEFPRTRLVIMGTVFDGVLRDLPQDRIDKVDWTTPELYPHIFKTLNLDIGIAPLKDTTFNRSKSEIKWEEYSALEIPAIASNVPPYSLAIDHEKTGFLASNTDEWKEYFQKLITSKELRLSMGKEARKKVKEEYDLEKGIEIYRETYAGLFKPSLAII